MSIQVRSGDEWRTCGNALAYEGLELAAEPGLTLTIHTTESGSASEEGLRLFSSRSATPEAEQTSHQPSD